MHIIESGDVDKPVATLSPLTKLSSNDAYYSTFSLRSDTEDDMPNWVIHPFLFSFAASRTDRRHNRNSKRGPTDQTTDRVIKSDDRKAVIAALATLSLSRHCWSIYRLQKEVFQAGRVHSCLPLFAALLSFLVIWRKGRFSRSLFPLWFLRRTDERRTDVVPPSLIPRLPIIGRERERV